ncbi:SAM-dependent methyltransferase [Actinophytocola gossypii]|uniref:Methyltransferase domain-containing protein n=1 Tax=Actinophytocola gossypii TaxID=2812003 RepID=A0ABT2J520_9PSEU|nr:methyltransferase [Actinophytocola gossypii]MCT2582856.1 methyltransferase domain-containing protein [Actinophytocola gossypii]
MPIGLGDEEAAAYASGEAPGSFVDMLGTAAYRCAAAAQRLGVFGALADGPLTAPALAAAIGADQRGVGLLADALVEFGYLDHTGDGYASTPVAAKWLAGSAGYAVVELFWQRVLFELWDGLEESVRTGKPAVDFYAWLAERPETSRHFQTMLDAHATHLAAEVGDLLPVSDGSVLDLGGGHGRYSIALCQRHPGLTATVVDFPGALGTAAVEAAGLTDRVTMRAGDYTREPLGTGHDLVLLFNVLHGHTEANNRALLARVAEALRPGGTVAILENSTDVPPEEGRAGVAFLHTFSLNLFHGQGGQVYPAARIGGWLTDAGFRAPTTTRLRESPGQHLILAQRSA